MRMRRTGAAARFLALMLSFMLLLACLAACGKGAGNEPTDDPTDTALLAGSWAASGMPEYVYTFNADGTGSYSVDGGETAFFTFTYEDDGSAITINYDNGFVPSVFRYSVSGNTLSITDSFDEVFEFDRL